MKFIQRSYETVYRTAPFPTGKGLKPSRLLHEAINEYFESAQAHLRENDAFTAQGMRDYFYDNRLGRFLTKRFGDGANGYIFGDTLADGWPVRDHVRFELTCWTSNNGQTRWLHFEGISIGDEPFRREYCDVAHPQGPFRSPIQHHLSEWPKD